MNTHVKPSFPVLFDEPLYDLPVTMELIRTRDTSIRALSREERDALILRVLKEVGSSKLTLTGDPDKWERCWKDVLIKFKKSGDINDLVPPFVIRGRECRLFGDYVMPESPYFEEDVDTILRSWLFERYMGTDGDVFEFGCGSGWNLAMLSQYYPNKKLHGVEWSKSAVEILDVLREKHGMNIEGHLFNMFDPGELHMPSNSVVFTHGAMEQMGTNFRPFVEFLMLKRVKRVINVEVLNEYYDPEHLLDYLSLMFHKKRNYLTNYLTLIEELERWDKTIRIVKSHHVQFGSLFQDGFSVLIWEPVYV